MVRSDVNYRTKLSNSFFRNCAIKSGYRLALRANVYEAMESYSVSKKKLAVLFMNIEKVNRFINFHDMIASLQ